MDFSLEVVNQWYELVMFTASMEIYGSAVADKLDDSKSILFCLFWFWVLVFLFVCLLCFGGGLFVWFDLVFSFLSFLLFVFCFLLVFFVCLFVCFVLFFETGFLCIGLAVLELTL